MPYYCKLVDIYILKENMKICISIFVMEIIRKIIFIGRVKEIFVLGNMLLNPLIPDPTKSSNTQTIHCHF